MYMVSQQQSMGLCVSWRNEVRKKQEVFSIPDALVHMDRDTPQSTMDRASNTTSQYHVELKVLLYKGQEWLCCPILER